MLGKLFDRRPAEKTRDAGAERAEDSAALGRMGDAAQAAGMKEPGLRVLDIGSTSPTNINFLTELGQSVYMADLVEEAS
jgi:hypothetical protein